MTFASSYFGRLRASREADCGEFAAGEGHGSESARRATESVLMPEGRPGGWLLLVAALWLLVLVDAVLARFA